LQKEHVRVDVIASRLSKRTQIWIDLFGFLFFLTPMCWVVLWYGVPFFLQGYASNEMSSNAGGLIRWPVYAMMPLGFGLLMLQGFSEIIKRIGFLMGLIEDPTLKQSEQTAQEELAESIRRMDQGSKRAGPSASKAD